MIAVQKQPTVEEPSMDTKEAIFLILTILGVLGAVGGVMVCSLPSSKHSESILTPV